MSTDAAALVADRVTQLLDEADPTALSMEEFRGRQYDLGLAWVHFPEGWGGLGIAPNPSARWMPTCARPVPGRRTRGTSSA